MELFMKRTTLLTLAMFFAGFFLPVFLHGQDVASLTGVVTDKTGAVLPGVTVKLVDTRTNNSYEAKTNAAGAYVFPKLNPGPGYKLTFTKDGFQSYAVGNIYVGVQTAHTQNVQLEIGAITQTVEVSGNGQTVTLDTTDATIGNNFDMRSVHELPVQVRESPAALLSLQPGVITANAPHDNPNQSRDGAITGRAATRPISRSTAWM
jgi:hypothetical protein